MAGPPNRCLASLSGRQSLPKTSDEKCLAFLGLDMEDPFSPWSLFFFSVHGSFVMFLLPVSIDLCCCVVNVCCWCVV